PKLVEQVPPSMAASFPQLQQRRLVGIEQARTLAAARPLRGPTLVTTLLLPTHISTNRIAGQPEVAGTGPQRRSCGVERGDAPGAFLAQCRPRRAGLGGGRRRCHRKMAPARVADETALAR